MCISKTPCRRRDEGFRSAGEDDSENRRFRDLKKYYVYRYGCPIKKDVKKRRTRTRWRGCCLFYLLFYTVYCSGNRLKLNISPYGESSFIHLTELKFKFWRVTFFKRYLTIEKLWDRLQFSRNNRFMMCICIWDEEIHVIENWIFSDYHVLFLLLNDPQIENYL